MYKMKKNSSLKKGYIVRASIWESSPAQSSQAGKYTFQLTIPLSSEHASCDVYLPANNTFQLGAC